MSMDASPRKEEFALSDNRTQIALAKFAFRLEHPDVEAPSNNDIMLPWAQDHAADFRAAVEKKPGATLKINDESALAEIYEAILKEHDAASKTMH